MCVCVCVCVRVRVRVCACAGVCACMYKYHIVPNRKYQPLQIFHLALLLEESLLMQLDSTPGISMPLLGYYNIWESWGHVL